jgi:pyrroloquinoline quinone biosynthesis protein B
VANASPDLRQQLESLAVGAGRAPGDPPPAALTAFGTPRSTGRLRHPHGVRSAPIAGVLLTDAEIDHTAGLLLLRESTTPIRVYGSDGVRRALGDGYPVLPILARYCGMEWHTLEPGRSVALERSSLEVEAFGAGGDAPRYMDASAQLEASGLVFRDRATGGVLAYAPGLARLGDDVCERLGASDAVLVDGTFWRDAELLELGISQRTARQMGHVPLSGTGGTLEALALLTRPRKILVHVNNTNPILIEDSPELAAVREAGIEVAYDGLEVEL